MPRTKTTSKTVLAKAGNVVLRKKKTAKGTFSLYLDSFDVSTKKRTYTFLKLYLIGDVLQDAKTLDIAKAVMLRQANEVMLNPYSELDRSRFDDNFIEYMQEQVDTHKKAIKHWRITLVHLRGYTKDHIKFRQITPSWLNNFKEFLLTKFSRNTASLYYDTVKAALELAVKDGIIPQNPAKQTPTISKKSAHKEFLTIEELRQLNIEDCKSTEVKYAFLFSCYTGLRLSDVRRLKKKDLKSNRISIQQKKTEEIIYQELSPQALELCQSARGNGESIFGLPNSDWTINEYLKAWGKQAGIDKNMHFHMARHTFATLLISNAVDLYTISKLLGHNEIRTTQIYTHIIDKTKREAVQKLPTL